MSSALCGCKMSDNILLKTVKIYIVVKNKVFILFVCLLHIVDMHAVK
jgi:hypothetical protein